MSLPLSASSRRRRCQPATIVVATVAVLGSLMAAGCSSAPTSDAERSTLAASADSTLTRFKNADPTLQGLLDRSIGYVVFPEVSKAGLGVGGAFGQGEVFAHSGTGATKVGFASITQGTIGLQVGAQTFSQLIVFMRDEQFAEFKADKFAFSANASAIAATSGAASAADYSKGVIAFTIAKGGLMAEASIGGQKFHFKPL